MRLLGANSSSFGNVNQSRGMKILMGVSRQCTNNGVLERRCCAWDQSRRLDGGVKEFRRANANLLDFPYEYLYSSSRDLLNIDVENGRLGWQTERRHYQSSSGVYVKQAVKTHVERLLRPNPHALVAIRLLSTPPRIRESDSSQLSCLRRHTGDLRP